ncbi:metal-dependent hydrolase [Streptomyces sp. CB01881]|uniref:metal-dependent hydrolase n=1 Tax=Streptomyces sp. CB01881 TaxID=2078691 RepID=UPI000CDC99A1|nr:metal-dependent hydrolase [Streptomyces sp. CB01881]AUY50839.1 metal-dependent hydrolase [Streptomyces sp. CB01881]TYC74221.1 metal-dependent hydrolase [Streptomyces sp. CB01881]
MTLPTTHVSFPAGAVTGESPVLAVHPLDGGRYAVVTEATPFHPLDHTWPDQPADLGTLSVDGTELAVVDCLTGAVGPDGGAPLVGADIPVRRGDEEWSWLVLHVVDGDPGDLAGKVASLAVDTERRAALCASHSGCHLLALALNAALAPRWRKDPGRADAFGNPDFDSLAMDTSVMDTEASTDTYRLGKSLRKKGFTTDATEEFPALADALPALTEAVNRQLAAWVAADAAVRIDVPGPELTARRQWHCELPEGPAQIFCGGTHLHHLGELAELRTELRLSEDGSELVAVTRPKRA